MKKVVVFLIFGFISMGGYSNEQSMNKTLLQVINQLNATLPLLEKARKEQPKVSRSIIHFNKFKNANGKVVNGVRDDLLEIRNALIAHINNQPIAPKKVTSLAFDFIEGD